MKLNIGKLFRNYIEFLSKNVFGFFCIFLIFFFITNEKLISQQKDFRAKYYDVFIPDEKVNDVGKKEGIRIDFSDFEKWRPKVGIALSGGGSRGFAQIGVLKVLHKEGIPIDYIVGTSIGSVVAGLYAVGYSPDEMDSIVRDTEWKEILSLSEESSRSEYFLDQKIIRDRSLVTLRFKNFNFVIPEAISVGNKFNAFLQRIIWNGLYHDNSDFNSLKIPFRAVSTDLISGETKLLGSGNLITAIKASSSIPLRYTPVRLDSMVLVDGGLMANIPIKSLDEFSPDITIAVNTVSPLLRYEELDKPWNIADQVVSILMKKFSDSICDLADINIQPDLGEHKNTDFSHLDSLIKQGEIKTQEIVDKIKAKYMTELFDKVRERISDLPHNIIKLDLKGLNYADSLGIAGTVIDGRLSYEDFIQVFSGILREDNYRKIYLEYDESNASLLIFAEQYPRITSISINDDSNLLNDGFEQIVNELFEGNKLNYANFILVSEYVIRNLRKQGVSFSGITDFDFDSNTGTMKLRVTASKVHSINIESTGEYDFLISRELNFKEGEIASADKLIDSWDNINSLDFISNVEMQIVWEGGDSLMNVIVKTRDIGDQTIRLGMRVDNERFAQLGIDLIQDNLWNQGTRLSLRFTGGLRNKALILKAENTRIFNTFLTSAYSFYYDNMERYVYQKKNLENRNRFGYERAGELTEERYGVNLMVGTQIERKGAFSTALRYENFRFWENSVKKIPDFKSFVTLKIAAIFDTEDRSDFATEGNMIDMSIESSLFSTEDRVSFSKVNFKYQSYHTWGLHTLKPILNFGFGDETTPLTEFYNLGGQDIFFGMREDESRGRQIAVGSLEYRLRSPYYVFFDTYLSFRYDLGYVWENFETIRFNSLKHGIGGILAFDTPVGPARFSLGRSFYFLKNPNAVAWGDVFGYFSIGMKL